MVVVVVVVYRTALPVCAAVGGGGGFGNSSSTTQLHSTPRRYTLGNSTRRAHSCRVTRGSGASCSCSCSCSFSCSCCACRARSTKSTPPSCLDYPAQLLYRSISLAPIQHSSMQVHYQILVRPHLPHLHPINPNKHISPRIIHHPPPPLPPPAPITATTPDRLDRASPSRYP